MLHDFLALVYSRNFVACGNSLYKHEEQICNYCYIHLPKSNFHKSLQNPVAALFYGRVKLEFSSSFYVFQKKSSIQKIMHAVKYQSNKDLAALVGKWYAEDLRSHETIKDAEVVIPVPLHQQKLKQRGYNQSEEFAKGLAEGLN